MALKTKYTVANPEDVLKYFNIIILHGDTGNTEKLYGYTENNKLNIPSYELFLAANSQEHYLSKYNVYVFHENVFIEEMNKADENRLF